MNKKGIEAATLCWVEQFVVGMNLCPFAGAVLRTSRLKIQVSTATDPEQLIAELENELRFLTEADPLKWETTLLVHPGTLTDFASYLDFLAIANELLVAGEWEGEIQIASFHPQYQFAGEDAEALSHFTNRSPFPMLHLLREESVEKAIDTHPDVAGVPARNVAYLNQLGRETVITKQKNCQELAS